MLVELRGQADPRPGPGSRASKNGLDTAQPSPQTVQNTDNYLLPAATVIATSAGKSAQYKIIVIMIVINNVWDEKLTAYIKGYPWPMMRVRVFQGFSNLYPDPYPQYPYPYTCGVFETLAHHYWQLCWWITPVQSLGPQPSIEVYWKWMKVMLSSQKIWAYLFS